MTTISWSGADPDPSDSDPTPEAIARVLRDPEMIEATQVPYLPPAPAPRPYISGEAVFDAKAIVEAGRPVADYPMFGRMPKVSPERQASLEIARAQMRRKRIRNAVVAWALGIVFVAGVAGSAYALYRLYQNDQEPPAGSEQSGP